MSDFFQTRPISGIKLKKITKISSLIAIQGSPEKNAGFICFLHIAEIEIPHEVVNRMYTAHD